MTTTAAQPMGSSRAVALGLVSSAGLGGCAITALISALPAVSRAASAQRLPVDQGLLLITQVAIGAVLLALGWMCLIGACSLWPSGSSQRNPRSWARARAPRMAPLMGSVLLAVTLSTPATAAELPMSSPAPVASSGLAPGAGSTGPSGTDTDSEPKAPNQGHTAGTPAVPLPGWQPTPRSDAVQESPSEVVVVRGDSLWAIAANHLGPAATDEQIAAEWPRWYAANRLTIGPDPDVILPGHILTPPRPTTPSVQSTPTGEQP